MNITDNYTRWDFIGLSTEDKPTAETSKKVCDGSTYYECDTSYLYIYCRGQWYKKNTMVQLPVERAIKW